MVYGPMMIDLKGVSLSPVEREIIQHSAVGGVILFKRNYQNKDQLKHLVAEIRDASKKPLLVAVDHEGGRVWRFTEGFTKLPPARHFGELFQKNTKLGLEETYNAAKTMATELLDCGLDFSLAPILDLDKGVSEVIGDRSYSADPKIVIEVARAFIQGMTEAGMAATGKHFPGHGSCSSDTHLEQAIDNRSKADIMNEDGLPFRYLSSELKAVMPAHVIYPEVDNVPAGYSKRWLQEILRGELGFQGAVISDCLSMKGAAIGGDFVVRTRMALEAGCDMVILCQNTQDLYENIVSNGNKLVVEWVLEKLDRKTSVESNQRLSQMAGNFKKKQKLKGNSLEQKATTSSAV